MQFCNALKDNLDYGSLCLITVRRVRERYRKLCLFVVYAFNKVSLDKTTFVTHLAVALSMIFSANQGHASADRHSVIDERTLPTAN